MCWPSTGARRTGTIRPMDRGAEAFEHSVPGLDPCPHCGQPVEMRRIEGTPDYRIACPECPWTVEVPGPVADVGLVVTAWNRRA